MSQTPRDRTEAKLYNAIATFNATAHWDILRLAQMRQYLAEHLANALVPSWLHERKAETAGEEIAHVLLMVGLMPSDWLDAHRAEVLADDGQAYPGELAMLHGLIATLRVVAEHGDLRQVRKLLEEHKADDAAARAETVTAPAGPTGRVAQLLDAIRTGRGRWTTVTAFRFYRDHIRSLDHIPNTQLRAVARGDLRDLTAWGHLARHEEPGRQYYTLKTPKDGAS